MDDDEIQARIAGLEATIDQNLDELIRVAQLYKDRTARITELPTPVGIERRETSAYTFMVASKFYRDQAHAATDQLLNLLELRAKNVRSR